MVKCFSVSTTSICIDQYIAQTYITICIHNTVISWLVMVILIMKGFKAFRIFIQVRLVIDSSRRLEVTFQSRGVVGVTPCNELRGGEATNPSSTPLLPPAAAYQNKNSLS